MNKKDFLNKLYSYLGGIPAEERQGVINDFEEDFKEAMAEGITEEEIAVGTTSGNISLNYN